MNPHYAAVARRAGHRCEYCRAPEVLFNLPFEVEHVAPAARGGAEDGSNLALACRSCNMYKSDHVSGVDPQTGTMVGLFHPRSNRWTDHFTVDLESGKVHGLTAVGRATVERLRLNDPAQLTARQFWIGLRLFP